MKGPRQRITIDPTAPDPNLLAEAVSILCDGGVVAYPTETFYGLAVDALDPGARARVFAIKGRERDQQLPCIVADLTQLEQLVGEIPEMVRRAAERLWPGPITLVLRVRTELEATLGTTVAVRVSSLPVARELARATGSPITSTSANRTGALPASTADEVESGLAGRVDLILDGGATAGGAPSTIVDATGRQLRLLRQGAVPFETVRAALT